MPDCKPFDHENVLEAVGRLKSAHADLEEAGKTLKEIGARRNLYGDLWQQGRSARALADVVWAIVHRVIMLEREHKTP
jgi:hypothetical protein